MSSDHCPRIKLNTGAPFPQVGLGTWQAPKGEVGEAVKSAIDAGYRHIDCAFVYSNEAEIGEALKEKIGSKVKREDLFITSKLWNTYHRKEHAHECLEKTLKDLQLDYIDLYIIHWPQCFVYQKDSLFPKDEHGKLKYDDIHFTETWKVMEELYHSGKVKAIGLSNFNLHQLQEILSIAKVTPAVLQIENHPYLPQKELVEFCKSKGIVVTAYSPLGSPTRPSKKDNHPVLLEDPKIEALAKKYHKNAGQVLIRYQIDRGHVVIPKSSKAERVKSNFDVFDFKLTEEDLKSLDGLPHFRAISIWESADHPFYPFPEKTNQNHIQN